MPALRTRLIAIGVLGVVFVALTIAITGGAFASLDVQVAQAMHTAWRPSLHIVFQVIAELGGVELTGIVMAGLALFVWRSGFGSDAFVFLALIGADAFELFYKLNLHHPGPPATLAQDDGPSISQLFSGGVAGAGNSFPSGHMMRTVIVYGLLAFVIRRLSPSPWVRLLAVAGAILVVVVM
ncbi:MAG TPA: phosphatase PAP2 family protein, partial [Candidatus Dormibacteraeota bacterium]|nr:phosphatase PAP2 family protein [Candidatus Dormibacteraeota bacterium]